MNKLFLKKTLPLLFVLALAALVVSVVTLNTRRSEAVVHNEQQTEVITPAQQQTGAVTVKVQNYVSPEGKKCYQYTVENNVDRPLVRLEIGTNQSTDETELVTLPRWWVDPEDAPGLREASDSASMVDAFRAEEQDNYFVSTKAFRANAGETRGFHVCMQSDWDSSYQTAHWIAYIMDGSTRAGQLINLKSIKGSA